MSTSSPELNSNQTLAIIRRTNDILEGPIIPVMLKLALPTLAVLVVQTFVGIMETYFAGSLESDSLAGVSVVFPVLMIMQMMANGGIGRGFASAVSRVLGAGKQEEVQSFDTLSCKLTTPDYFAELSASLYVSLWFIFMSTYG